MKKVWLLTLVIGASISLWAQNSKDVLLTIDNTPVYADQFVYQYLKNNTGVKDSLSVDEYLDLFINFKLKVKQAEDLGYDTSASFHKEYYDYLLQVAEPYFKSQKIRDSLVKVYYDKLQKQVRFSYIVIPIPKGGDTAEVYNTMLDIRKKALNGVPFGELVRKYSVSRTKDYNDGDVGFVTVFDVPPSFEPFLFDNGKKGDVSMPVRFMNMYYLMKITDIQPNRGQVKVEHILVAFPQGGPAKDSLAALDKVQKIEKDLAQGKSFEQLAKTYSDDFRTAKNGGMLGWIKPGQTLPKFQDAAFSIDSVGGIVGPIRTKIGWEFIKLVDRKTLGNIDAEQEYILEKMRRRPAYRLITSYVIDSLKKAYGYKMVGSLDGFYALNDTVLNKNWDPSVFSEKPLFVLNGKTYTERDFANYLSQYPHMGFGSVKELIDSEYDRYLTKVVKENYVDYLIDHDDNFGKLATEFYEGLLLFNISSDKVWNKAQTDTAGLRKFFNRNRNKYYQKLNIVVFEPLNKRYGKKLVKLLKKQSDLDTVFFGALDTSKVKVVYQGIVSTEKPGDFQELFDIFKAGKVKPNQKVIILSDGKIVFLKNNFRLVTGTVMADYQDYLDQQWLNELKKHHKVSVNEKVKQKVENQIKQQRKK